MHVWRMSRSTAQRVAIVGPTGRCARGPGAAFRAWQLMGVGVAVWLALPQAGGAHFRESFEGVEPSWRLADHDCGIRVTQQVRTFDHAKAGQASEYLRFQVGTGTFAHWTHAVPRSAVIDELQISVWIKSNRSHLQFAARAVLPRSKDPRTGGPLTTLIRGTPYLQAGTWEKLTIDVPTRLLAKQLPLLRSEFGADVDVREAYIDMVVLNVYGGPGVGEVWLDDLEVLGQVSVEGIPSVTSMEPPPLPGGAAGSTSATAPPTAELVGSVLMVAGRPRLARVIDHQGESFVWLKTLGFNMVRLRAPPTAEQVREAREADMWLMAAPPVSAAPTDDSSSLAQVVAWDLGEQLGSADLESTNLMARRLRGVPDGARRPLICSAKEDVWQYSRAVDLMLLDPPGPNSSLPLHEYGTWYLHRARLPRSGTPFWATVRTDLPAPVTRQVLAMGGQGGVATSLEPEQIRSLAYHAIASGARGLVFRSESRLDAADTLTLLRARTLQLLNQDLQLLEPWAATGTYDGELATGDPLVRASVLKAERSRMVLAIRHSRDQQYVAGPIDERTISVDVPAVPETDEVYRLEESGLQRITRQRGTGVRIPLDSPRAISLVVLTQDPLVINFLTRQMHEARRRQDELLRQIASHAYTAVVETHQRLLELAPPTQLAGHAVSSHPLSLARTELQQFERLLDGGGHDQAYAHWERGLAQLAAIRQQDWRSAISSFPSPVASPLCVSYFLLPEHYALSQRLRGGAWGPNCLPGGDFENLQLLQSSGWRNLSVSAKEWTTGVELSLHGPHSGRSALRLQCWPVSVETAPHVIESPPVSIVTAPVMVKRGDIVRIHGWVRVPRAIQGSMDGVMIYDSMVGSQLAERIRTAAQWREFVLYRAAPRDGDMNVTFALCGMGEMWLDDVTITLLQVPGQATAAAGGDTNWGTAPLEDARQRVR